MSAPGLITYALQVCGYYFVKSLMPSMPWLLGETMRSVFFFFASGYYYWFDTGVLLLPLVVLKSNAKVRVEFFDSLYWP